MSRMRYRDKEIKSEKKKINFKMSNIVQFYIINDMATQPPKESNSNNEQITKQRAQNQHPNDFRCKSNNSTHVFLLQFL